jgi:hypothetical protein
MSMERMIEKARRLLKGGRVERLDNGRFNVIGDHGTYTVVQAPDGTITCNCPGFMDKRRCSHATAVVILTNFTDRRGVA